MSTLSFNCFILGSKSSQIFPVEILETKNVGVLRDLIKEKQSRRLDYVDASNLTIWKVSLPMDTITPELTADCIKTCQELHPVKRMSSIFGEALVDEHVHILVQAPAKVIQPDPAQLLSINCFVVGNPSRNVFTVKILKTDNVSILKDLIKEKQSRRLDHVDASDLILSQVSLPVVNDLQESLKNVDLVPLDPLLPLWQVFPRVEENRLHIVVQAPTNGGPISGCLYVSDDFTDSLFRGSEYQRRRRRGEERSDPCLAQKYAFSFSLSILK